MEVRRLYLFQSDCGNHQRPEKHPKLHRSATVPAVAQQALEECRATWGTEKAEATRVRNLHNNQMSDEMGPFSSLETKMFSLIDMNTHTQACTRARARIHTHSYLCSLLSLVVALLHSDDEIFL